jgi:hypothetical protein
MCLQGMGQPQSKEHVMRKILPILTFAAAAALATPALAEPDAINPNYGPTYYGAGPVLGGAVVGTAVGVGIYEGWFGTSAAVTALPTSAVGSAAVGGVAGIGTVALLDAAIQPCRGFHALLDLSHGQCVNGEYVGYAPRRVSSLHGRRVIER